MDDLTIFLKLDRSLAERESSAYHAGEKARIGQLLSDAEVAEKAKVEFVRRANQQRIQEAARASKTSVELARDAAQREAKAKADAAKEALKIEKEAADERARLDREIEKMMRDAARRRAAEERQEAAEKKRLDNRHLTDVEITEKAKAEIFRRANQQRIAEATKAHKTEIDLANQREKAMSAATRMATSFAGQVIGLTSASAVLSEVQAGFQRVRDAIFESSEMLAEYRESLLELAALKDRLGDTSAELVDALEIQAETGQTRQDVTDLQTGFLGMAELMVGEGEGKKISAEGAKEAMIGLGKFQAAQGAPAEAFGELGGMILQSAMGPITSEEITTRAAALYDIQQPGNFGKGGFGTAIKQFGMSLPFVNSGILTDKEAMALTSAFSISAGGESSGTALRQFLQGTVGSLSGDRKIKGLEDEPENIGAATYLKGLGAKAGMHPVEIAKLVAADVDRAEAEAKAKGEGFEAIDYLRRHGYSNQESALRMIQFRGLEDTGAWGGFKELIEDPTLGEGRLAEAEEKLRTDPALVARATKAAVEQAKIASSAGENEWMTSMRRAAYARLRADPENIGMREFEDIEKAGYWDLTSILTGDKIDLERETQRIIMDYADARGVPYKKSLQEPTYAPSVGAFGRESWSGIDQQEQFRLSRLLAEEHGVSIAADAMRDFAAGTKNMLEASGMLKDAAAKPPLQGAPRQGPADAGGFW